MPLVLYNSLTHREETFAPLDPEHVRLYVCGPTVYDRAHIGNARAVVVFDQLYRVLREVYGAGHVTYVRNITDVDDKIIDAARERGESITALTARTTADFHEDMKALGALPPDIEPRATRYIPQMIALIERLIAGGHAYAAPTPRDHGSRGDPEGSHVLFAVATAADYGKLSRRSREEMIAGARVEVAPYKRDPGDFVLWKPSPPDLPGWDSPWGRGRPGWHIECSAMSEANLGESFDIHGGGLDLIFPHHENEIAQSECAHDGRPLARLWMHNEMLTVDGVKMSKSLGNIRTVRDMLDEGVPGEAIRLALLSTHYRDPLDWTAEKLRQARLSLDRFYRALTLPRDPVFERFGEAEEAMAPVRDALMDDLNTPRALAALHELTGRINRTSSDAERSALQKALEQGGRLMGLLEQNPLDWQRGSLGNVQLRGEAQLYADAEVSNPRIDGLIEKRIELRRARRFAEADRIRAALAKEGIVLEDKPDGTTTWRRGA